MKYEQTKLPKSPILEAAFKIGYASTADFFGADTESANQTYKDTNLSILDTLVNSGDDVDNAVLAVVLLGPSSIGKVAEDKQTYRPLLGQDVMDLAIDMVNNPISNPEEAQKASLGMKQIFVGLMAMNMETYILPSVEENKVTKEDWQIHETTLIGMARGAKGAAPKLDQRIEDAVAKITAKLNANETPTPKSPKPPQR